MKCYLLVVPLFISLMITDVEHLFTYLLALSLSEKSLFKSASIVWSNYTGNFLLLHDKSASCIWTSVPYSSSPLSTSAFSLWLELCTDSGFLIFPDGVSVSLKWGMNRTLLLHRKQMGSLKPRRLLPLRCPGIRNSLMHREASAPFSGRHPAAFPLLLYTYRLGYLKQC